MLSYVNKDTVLCMSLSGRPGNFGTRFQNFLYSELGLNYIYKSFTTQDLEGAIRGIRALGIRGCAISMPFKEKTIEYLDEIHSSAQGIQAVNTVLNDGKRLIGFNTDYVAVRDLLKRNEIPITSSVAVLGSGGMAKAVVCALRDLGFRNVTVISRNLATGTALAQAYGYEWRNECNHSAFDLLINVTPIGMAPDPVGVMPFPQAVIEKAHFIFDAVAYPPETSLIQLGKKLGKKVISGFEITVIQALEQFQLYTGVHPPEELVAKAAVFARADAVSSEK